MAITIESLKRHKFATIVAIICLACAIVLAGFLQARHQDKSSSSQSANQQPYPVPAGYTSYSFPESTIWFVLPQNWGKLAPVSDKNYGVLFAAAGPVLQDISLGNAQLSGRASLVVYNAHTDKAFTVPLDQSTAVSPMLENGTYVWKVSVANTGSSYKVGDTYNPPTVQSNGGVTVYEFVLKTKTEETDNLFVASKDKNKFISITFPTVSIANQGSTSDFDKYHEIRQTVAKSVRYL